MPDLEYLKQVAATRGVPLRQLLSQTRAPDLPRKGEDLEPYIDKLLEWSRQRDYRARLLRELDL